MNNGNSSEGQGRDPVNPPNMHAFAFVLPGLAANAAIELDCIIRKKKVERTALNELVAFLKSWLVNVQEDDGRLKAGQIPGALVLWRAYKSLSLKPPAETVDELRNGLTPLVEKLEYITEKKRATVEELNFFLHFCVKVSQAAAFHREELYPTGYKRYLTA